MNNRCEPFRLSLPPAAALWLLGAIVFLSSFLLFQIELIVGKLFLGHYGGSYMVWGGCVVFFQAVLLAGYAFASAGTRRLAVSRYRWLHLALLMLPLFFFPGRPLTLFHFPLKMPLMADIFLQLTFSVGAVFFVLSTTSVVLQLCLAASSLPERERPQVLFAVSNLGAFAALLSYPVLIEVLFDLSQQLMLWRGLYFLLIGLTGIVVAGVPLRQDFKTQGSFCLWASPDQRAVQILLFCSATSALMMAVTTIITYEIVPMPLLWVLPLALYLLSFVLCFQSKPWCPAWIERKITAWILAAVFLYFLSAVRYFPVLLLVFLLLAILFILCLYGHRQVIALKPAEPQVLPAYYILIALGGFLGSALANWLSPPLADWPIEFMLGLILIVAAQALVKGDVRIPVGTSCLIMGTAAFICAWGLVSREYHLRWFLLLLGGLVLLAGRLRDKPFAVLIILVLCAVNQPLMMKVWLNSQKREVYSHRNYYGIHKVYDSGRVRILVNGRILHGAQFLEPARRRLPLTYFSPYGPMGQILSRESFGFKDIAVVGLGAGTLAAYARPEQRYDFYELDPEVLSIANRYFTFLRDCRGRVRVFLGDARINFENAPDRRYDMIVVDAFGGDAIPVHLLTVEAVQLFERHLRPGGIIVFHLSNQYLYLRPVLRRIADRLPGIFMLSQSSEDKWGVILGANCVALTSDPAKFFWLKDLGWHDRVPLDKKYSVRLWTDRYSNYWPIFHSDRMIGNLRNFCFWVW